MLLTTLGASTTARAQEAPAQVSVDVSAEGSGAAIFLEERLASDATRGDGWKHVCVLPCKAAVIADPVAQHRIVDGREVTPVFVPRSSTGARDVRYAPSSSPNGPLIVGGVLTLGTGAVLGIVGGVKLLGQMTIWGCGGDRSCEAEEARTKSARDDERSQARLFMGIGVALAVVGTIAVIAGAVSGGPARASARPLAMREPPRQPTPTWSLAAAPPHPSGHTTLFAVRF